MTEQQNQPTNEGQGYAHESYEGMTHGNTGGEAGSAASGGAGTTGVNGESKIRGKLLTNTSSLSIDEVPDNGGDGTAGSGSDAADDAGGQSSNGGIAPPGSPGYAGGGRDD